MIKYKGKPRNDCCGYSAMLSATGSFLFLISIQENHLESLQELAASVVLDTFDETAPYIENGVVCHIDAKHKIKRGIYRYSLQQWILLKSGFTLKKMKNLKSKTNTLNSVDINDLYY